MRRVLITGSMGNLGQAAVRVFHAAGWQVEGVSRTAGVDLTDWGAVNEFVARGERFDVVLFAHGTQQKVMASEFSRQAWDNIVGNNLMGAVSLSGALVAHNKLAPGALIVYCSSIQATQPRPGRGLYAVAKGGLESLTRAMAVELAPEGRVIALRLGQMAGQMAGIVFPEAEQARIREKTPLPWVGFEHTARLILDLYRQPSLSGEVIEISSLHKFSIWPG